MSEIPNPAPLDLTSDVYGWQQVAQEMHTYPPALQEHAIRNLAERGIEISPEHHQKHINIARPVVPNIEELPPEEQDLVGEVVEIGQEALEGEALPNSETTVANPPRLDRPLMGVSRLPNGELDYSAAASISLAPKPARSAGEESQLQNGIANQKKTTVAKSDELLQAQVASFARKNGYRAGLELFQRMGNLDKEPSDIAYSDHDNPAVIHTIRKQDYVDHLREIDGSGNETIQARKEALEAYKGFSPDTISWLKTIRAERQNADVGSHKQHPAFVGEGAYNAVFAFTHEGKEYVAKFNDNTEGAGHDVDDVVIDLAAGKGIDHLEQIVAISYEDGVAICERMPGKDFSKLDVEDLEDIPDEHLAQALQTMKEASDNGIFFDDHNETNYFYDKIKGFGFIDYANIKYSDLAPGSTLPSDSEMATNFIENLVIVDRNGIAPERIHEQTPREMNARIALLHRYHTVCEHVMQTKKIDYSDALKRVDDLIAEYTAASGTKNAAPHTTLMGVRTSANGEPDYSHAAVVRLPSKQDSLKV